MKKKVIKLNTEKELRIYMFPLRQQIIRAMEIEGKPITAKQIANKLNITPSSAKHHLLKLEQIGIVEFDHSEFINGIKANYMKLSDATISIGQNLNDNFNYERDAYAENIIYQVYKGYQKVLNDNRSRDIDFFLGDLVSGVVHLSEKDICELQEIIYRFINSNKNSRENTNPYEFAFVNYRANLDNEFKENSNEY